MSDLNQRLEEALKPWLAPAREYSRPRTNGFAAPASDKRILAYAEKALASEVSELRAVRKGGRNRRLFDAACKLGRYVHHGVIQREQVFEALLEAADANGSIADPDDGRRACEKSIASGLRKAEGDELPVLDDRHSGTQPNAHENRKTNGHGAAQHLNGSSPSRDKLLTELPQDVVDLVNTEAVDGDGLVFQTMIRLMDCGLSNEAVLLVAEGAPFARNTGDVDEELRGARSRWEGEARRTRAHVRVEPQHSQTNVPTDGGAVLDGVYQFLARFVVYPSEHAHVAHTLWLAHTHAMEAWESTPRLAALSPEPGSGKTRLLEVSELLVPRPVEAINVTPAYLFRKVADPEGRPTILYDEIDTVFGPKAKDNEEIRGLLNAGHRKGAVAGRCVIRGKTVETEEIPAYCAVALAGLGNLPDTVMSRAVVLRMRRRAPGEEVEPFRRRVHAQEGNDLRDQLAVWTGTALSDVINVWPEMPDCIKDRDADVWESLLAIADVAGGTWPQRAREAAVALVKLAKESSPSLGIRLLSDLRAVFGTADTMTTEAILRALHDLDESPWGDLKGKPLNDRGLAKLLRPYDVKPKSVRTSTAVVRGYARQDLHDAWARYLPSISPKSATGATGTTIEEGRGL